MRWYFKLILAIIITAPLLSFGQRITFPEFRGKQKSLEGHFHFWLKLREAAFSKICDTSVGFIEFYIGKNGEVKSIAIPPNFPEELNEIIYTTLRSSVWSPMKIDDEAVESLPILLPFYISIEAGCQDNNIKKGLGPGRDFERITPTFKNEPIQHSLLLRPVVFTLIRPKEPDSKKE